MALTKAHIVTNIQNQLNFTRKDSIDILEILLEDIKKALEQGQDVMISKFGKFCVREKKERKGRNPATGKSMQLRPRRVVTFKSSAQLKDKVNRS